jgi:TRAP transporter TAXI family solute receptor
MRSKLLSSIVLGGFTLLSLIGCSSEKPQVEVPENSPVVSQSEATKESEKTGANKSFVFATGSEKGTYYPVGNAIIDVCSSDNVKISSLKSPGSTQNVQSLSKNEAQFALVQSLDIYDGYKGKGAFDGKADTSYRAVLSIFPSVAHFVVGAQSGISTITDLKGKDFAVGPDGSSTERNSKDILKAYDIDYKTKKDLNPQYPSFAESTKLYDAKKIVGGAFSSGIPFSSVTEWYSKYDVKMLSIDDAKADAIIKESPGYFKYTIKAKTYGEKQGQDIKTLAANTLLVCRNDVPEETVYLVVKNIIEKQVSLAKVHGAFSDVSLKTALNGVPIPLHKGALKYYSENKVEVPDSLKAK